ncbi:MAG: hypothetical protein JHC93_05285 [Parachlamydiales bacterium]|nr:hypothetical protein [Parachlamydiales bacterium]
MGSHLLRDNVLAEMNKKMPFMSEFWLHIQNLSHIEASSLFSFRYLIHLNIDNAKSISEKKIRGLGALRDLKWLRIDTGKFDDNEFYSALLKLKKLKKLYLSNIKCNSSKYFFAISKLSQLTAVHLFNCQKANFKNVTNIVCNLKHIEEFELSLPLNLSCYVLPWIDSFIHLKDLRLTSLRDVSDLSVGSFLFKLTNLKILFLDELNGLTTVTFDLIAQKLTMLRALSVDSIGNSESTSLKLLALPYLMYFKTNQIAMTHEVKLFAENQNIILFEHDFFPF